jgi:hypothetical protein
MRSHSSSGAPSMGPSSITPALLITISRRPSSPVAEAKGFQAAGERLGLSGSAVSQALRRLEKRLGVALVQRTTCSVRGRG